MQLTTVESSMIYAVGYDPETQTLTAVFNNSGTYEYYDVPPEEYEGLMAADSKGSYMRNNIIDMYDYAPIKQRRRR